MGDVWVPDVEDFIREMQNITPEEIHRSKKLIRPYMRKKMVQSDVKRKEILEEFVGMLEDKRPVEYWLSKFNFSNAIMTP